MPMLILLLQGVEFWAVNTDAQALENTLSSNKLQLGGELTRGLGVPRPAALNPTPTQSICCNMACSGREFQCSC
jgi:hypothetical protein